MHPAPGIIAIGASLGGLAAVRVLLRGLPASLECAVVLVQHRTPDGSNRLVDLLSSHCRLPVCEPDDKEPIRAGRVYVAPSDYHLIVERDFFSLSMDAPVCFARPSIDVLFESVADSYCEAGVAVMLTGSNDDGAAGAVAIKKAGGRVLVQEPASAEAPEAPRAVLARTAVDDVLPIEQLAARLIGLRWTPRQFVFESR